MALLKESSKTKLLRAISCGLSPLHSSSTRHIISAHDAAKSSKDMIYTTELDSPSHKDGFRGDTPLHTSHCIDATSSPVIHNAPCLLDECMNLKQPQLCVHDDLWEEDPLSALLDGSRTPLAKCAEDAQKLVWLKLQLIGETQEFVTPFGKRDLVYADHTASGRSLFFIEDFVSRHLLPFYGNTHTDDSYVGGRTSKMMKQAEDYIKRQLGGSKDDALVMCGWGCTAAIKRLQEVMGIAIPSNLRGRVLDMMEASTKEERWLVFTGPYEHHSNLLSWRQSLAEVIEIPANGEGEMDMGKLEEALRAAEASGRRQKMGAFSACSNVTGVLSDTRAIARLLHKYGAFVCFDFAAGAPHLQVEMRSRQEDGYDAVVMSPHKLLGGPSTPGILLMRKRLYKLRNLPPSTCGGGTVAYVNGFNEEDTLYYEDIEEREEGGTPPIVGKVRCALAFWLKETMGLPMIKQRENLHMNQAMKRLSIHPNVQILGGLPPASWSRAPILSFVIHTDYTLNPQEGFENSVSNIRKPLHGRFVVKLLNDLFGIQARGGCSCAGPYGHLLLGVGHDLSLAIRSAIQMGYEGLKPGWARVSLCYSMTDEEVDYILSAIELLANYGQRFLALYDFDWHSGNWTYAHGKALQFISNEIGGQLLQTVTFPQLLQNNGSWGQRVRFRRFLCLARALAHLLPKFPQPTTVPEGVDPKLLLFT